MQNVIVTVSIQKYIADDSDDSEEDGAEGETYLKDALSVCNRMPFPERAEISGGQKASNK